MGQIVWLDFRGGVWHLVTGVAQDRDRTWTDRGAALSDLRAEGWTVDGPHGGLTRSARNANLHLYGYGLTRVLH